MKHPPFKQIIAAQWAGDQGNLTYTLYALDAEGEVWERLGRSPWQPITESKPQYQTKPKPKQRGMYDTQFDTREEEPPF